MIIYMVIWGFNYLLIIVMQVNQISQLYERIKRIEYGVANVEARIDAEVREQSLFQCYFTANQQAQLKQYQQRLVKSQKKLKKTLQTCSSKQTYDIGKTLALKELRESLVAQLHELKTELKVDNEKLRNCKKSERQIKKLESQILQIKQSEKGVSNQKEKVEKFSQEVANKMRKLEESQKQIELQLIKEQNEQIEKSYIEEDYSNWLKMNFAKKQLVEDIQTTNTEFQIKQTKKRESIETAASKIRDLEGIFERLETTTNQQQEIIKSIMKKEGILIEQILEEKSSYQYPQNIDTESEYDINEGRQRYSGFLEVLRRQCEPNDISNLGKKLKLQQKLNRKKQRLVTAKYRYTEGIAQQIPSSTIKHNQMKGYQPKKFSLPLAQIKATSTARIPAKSHQNQKPQYQQTEPSMVKSNYFQKDDDLFESLKKNKRVRTKTGYHYESEQLSSSIVRSSAERKSVILQYQDILRRKKSVESYKSPFKLKPQSYSHTKRRGGRSMERKPIQTRQSDREHEQQYTNGRSPNEKLITISQGHQTINNDYSYP